MARLYLVRHGKARAGWSEDPDPGLDDLGRKQAERAAEKLSPLGPMQIVTSPIRRARETADALAKKWGVVPKIDERVSEIPSTGMTLAERGPWLMKIMASKWPDQSPALRHWRDQVVAALIELEADTAVFSHFIAINAAVGEATADPRVVSFSPGNGSITVLENKGGKLSLVSLGDQADTPVG